MKPHIHIFPESDSLSHTAADMFVEIASGAVEKRERFLVALSGGGTPSGLYRLLASDSYRKQVDWSKTFIFWGDERCVPPDDAGSNYRQAMDILLSKVPIPDENIQRIKGELEPAEAVLNYRSILMKFANSPFLWPRFDLILLGMGEDGHTASLFPGTEVDPTSPVIVASAHYQNRPARRISLTPPVINDAQNIMFLVTGTAKAITLGKVLGKQKIPRQLPAQRIYPIDGKLIWLVDDAAASEIKWQGNL